MCVTCKDVDDVIRVGDYVHRKDFCMGVRVGGAEIHQVMYLSKYSAIVQISNQSGTFLTEELLSKVEFLKRYEKCT